MKNLFEKSFNINAFLPSSMAFFTSIILIILIYIFFPNTKALFVISSKTEIINFKVTDPSKAKFSGHGLSIAQYDSDATICLDGVVSPAYGASIEYRKQSDHLNGRFSIEIIPPNEKLIDITSEISINGNNVAKNEDILLFENLDCGKLKTERFPIWGLGTIGGPLGNAADGRRPVLISGKIELFGRGAVREKDGARRVFRTSETALNLGPASLVYTPQDRDDGTNDNVLRGYATPSLNSIDVLVETEADDILIEASGGRKDRFEISLFDKFFHDPYMQILSVFILFFFAVFPIASAFFPSDKAD